MLHRARRIIPHLKVLGLHLAVIFLVLLILHAGSKGRFQPFQILIGESMAWLKMGRTEAFSRPQGQAFINPEDIILPCSLQPDRGSE